MTEPQPATEKALTWAELVPPGWFKKPDESSVWLTGYRVLRVPKEMLVQPRILDLTGARAMFLYGKLNYQDASQLEIEFVTETQWTIDGGKLVERETREGAYLLLMCPFDKDGEKGNEASTKQIIAVCAALFATFFGRNIVYQRLFENILQCGTGQASCYSSTFENPLSFPAPLIGSGQLAVLEAADRKIASLRDQDKNRIRLSLRWFESAMYDRSIDAFLKYWIAIETVGMPDDTNIRPLNESLAAVYGNTAEVARDRFSVGKIFGLRSRIVHKGLIVPIYDQLLKYTEAIYIDVLHYHLGLPSLKKAEAVASDPTFNLSAYLPQ